jgi:hypothetical protein
MDIDFSYIRNRISEFRKDDLLEYCYHLLDTKKGKPFPIWYVLTLMKWTLIYGEKKYPSKELSPDKFNKLFNIITNFNEEHITQFFKKKQVSKAFQIIHNQQFYLQKSVYKEIFATQLKLFSKIQGQYDIVKSFLEKTGFAILDFLIIEQLVYYYINIEILKKPGIFFDGYLDGKFLTVASEITSVEKVKYFVNLLTLNPNKITESISSFRHKIKKEEWQTMEMSFFTMFPFTVYKNRIKLVHETIFYHSINYYIYDFLKSQDENFTTEFGSRLEKYIELGLKEIDVKFLNETELIKKLPEKSKVTDFFIEDENIFIECKATELQAYSSVNPTDELLFNSLKSSLFKAYFEQLVSVSQTLRPNAENWGIIITYKELFWSHFVELFNIGKEKYNSEQDYSHLPPENVFIIDIYSWDKIVQIVKDKKATLLEILKKAKANNSKPETSKLLFNMHLDDFDLKTMNLSYLQEEIIDLEINH